MSDDARADQVLWDAYRQHPDNKPLLEAAGVAGPDDLDAALKSKHVIETCAQDVEDNGPLLLGDHVLHTLGVFAVTELDPRGVSALSAKVKQLEAVTELLSDFVEDCALLSGHSIDTETTLEEELAQLSDHLHHLARTFSLTGEPRRVLVLGPAYGRDGEQYMSLGIGMTRYLWVLSPYAAHLLEDMSQEKPLVRGEMLEIHMDAGTGLIQIARIKE